MSRISALIRAAAEHWAPLVPAWRAVRAHWFRLRIKIAAAWSHALVDIEVAPDARIGRRVRVQFEPASRGTLRIGAGALIDDDVRILLLGGNVTIGEHTEIRRGCLLDVAGTLTLEGRNVVSWGTVIHCAESIRFAEYATCGEFVTLADSAHYFSERDESHRENVDSAPITVGHNTWVGAKATISKGVSVGANAVVGANSVVTRDVPDGHLAAGVPAKLVRRLELPGEASETPEDYTLET